MTSIQFAGPPGNYQGAALYQHARSTIEFVERARDLVQDLDDRDGFDLNREPGTVVLGQALPVNLSLDLAGSQEKPSYNKLYGSIKPGEFGATLYGPGLECRISAREDAHKTSYCLDLGSNFPGRIQVTRDRSSGALTLDQEQPLPWKVEVGRGELECDQMIEAKGPQAQQVGAYLLSEDLRQQIDAEINHLRQKQAGPEDLAGRPGLVVAAGLHSVEPKNLDRINYTSGEKPSEGWLRYDVQSGEVQEYARGHEGEPTLLFRRDEEGQHYERWLPGQVERLEIAPNGARRYQQFAAFNRESAFPEFSHPLKVPRTPSAWRQKLGGTVLAAGTAGMVTGLLSSCLQAGPIAWGVAAAVAAATAVAVNIPRASGVLLSQGLHRFEGKDLEQETARAAQTFKSAQTSLQHAQKYEEWPLPAEGLDKAGCFELLEQARRRGGSLFFLVDRLGGRPAVMAVHEFPSLPLCADDQGLTFPDKTVVPYDRLKAVKIREV